MNRRILIEETIQNVSLSRSDLARITGLNKATVSTQISDLLNDHIVTEIRERESNTRGRKPILLEINGQAGYSIGIDIDDNSINVIFINLKGNPIKKMQIPVISNNLEQVIDSIIKRLSPSILKHNSMYQPIGLIGIGIGIHGIVNNDDEIIFTPKHNWSNVEITSKLEKAFQTKVFVDNNANLCAFAEQVYDEHIPDLFCVTLYSGIGLGIISKNEIYRGYHGFAGEIGHMIVETDGLHCSCGNKGCWELYASEKALKNRISNSFPTATSCNGFEELLRDHKFDSIIDHYIHYLAAGLNNIINIFNPEELILNGTMIKSGSPITERIHQKLKSKINNYREIRASNIRGNACALGGAVFALKQFFQIDTMNLVPYDYLNSKVLT